MIFITVIKSYYKKYNQLNLMSDYCSEVAAWQYRHVVSINTSVACTRPWHWQWGQVSDHEIAPVSRTQHMTSHAQNKIFDCFSTSWQSIVSLRPDADNKQSLHAACSAAQHCSGSCRFWQLNQGSQSSQEHAAINWFYPATTAATCCEWGFDGWSPKYFSCRLN